MWYLEGRNFIVILDLCRGHWFWDSELLLPLVFPLPSYSLEMGKKSWNSMRDVTMKKKIIWTTVFGPMYLSQVECLVSCSCQRENSHLSNTVPKPHPKAEYFIISLTSLSNVAICLCQIFTQNRKKWDMTVTCLALDVSDTRVYGIRTIQHLCHVPGDF